MPLSTKGSKIMSAMQRKYGAEKGERVFYGAKSKGTISGVEKRRSGGKPQFGAQRRLKRAGRIGRLGKMYSSAHAKKRMYQR
jgi:hypothetical protein